MTAAMTFLSYTPRADSDARGYDDWLRTVDNPFFNARQGIARYTNWKLAPAATPHPGFTHFDFMLFADGGSPTAVFGDMAVQQFVGEWTRLWGRAPEGTPADNCRCYFMTSDDAAAEPDADRVELSFDADDAEGETWTVVAALIGTASFRSLTRRFWTVADTPPLDLAATLIAGPQMIVPA